MKKLFTLEEAREVGASLGLDWNQIDLEQFRQGLAIELEHGARDPETNVTGDDLLLTKISVNQLVALPNTSLLCIVTTATHHLSIRTRFARTVENRSIQLPPHFLRKSNPNQASSPAAPASTCWSFSAWGVYVVCCTPGRISLPIYSSNPSKGNPTSFNPGSTSSARQLRVCPSLQEKYFSQSMERSSIGPWEMKPFHTASGTSV